MRILRNLFLILILFMVSSCVFRPKYTPPCVNAPDEWRTDSNPESQAVNLRWWEQFGDPVLDYLIETAVANNYDLKVAVARVDEFYGRLGITEADLYPQINGSIVGTRQQASLTAIPPFPPALRRYDNFSVTLNTIYELDIWGRIHSATDAALADLLASIQAERTVVLTIVSATASSYVDLRRQDSQLQISINTLKSRQESYRIAKIRYDGGLTSELEVKQAEALVKTAELAIVVLELSIARTENALSVLLGWNPTHIPRGRPLEKLILPDSVPAGLPSDLINQRPDILEAEDRLMATVSRVGEAKAALFPSITLTDIYGVVSPSIHNLFSEKSESFQYGLSLLQPIFRGGKLISGIDVARAQNREALWNYYETVLNAFKEVEDALVSYEKQIELVRIEIEHVSVLEDYLRLATLQYNNGQTEYLNVLDAERDLFTAQLNLAGLEGDRFLSLISLYKALGGGWDLDVNQENLPSPCSCSCD